MRNVPKSAIATPKPAFPASFLPLLSIVVLAIGGTILINVCYPGLTFNNEVFHTFLEATGAISALTLALMILLSKSEYEDSSLALVAAAGLISMSIIDAIHSIAPPGPLFFWLRSCSTFIGGFFFALSWFTPNHWLARLGNRFILAVVSSSFLFGFGSMYFSLQLPPVMVNGEFTFIAKSINAIGGVFFLAASVRYYFLYRRSHQLTDFFHIALCLLLGMAGMLVPWSAPWDIDWWYWHILRLCAYLSVLAHLTIFIQDSNRALHRSRAELTSSVNEGIRELAQTNALLQKENQKLLQSDQEKERAMALLRISEERWAFALEGNGDGVWDWDMVLGKVQLSQRWKEIFGYSQDEIGDTLSEWFALIHPDDLADMMAVIEANQDGKNHSFSSEHRMRHQQGHYLWVLARGMVALRDTQGMPLRIIGTHTDISDRKQIERMKNTFISTVSHELRTPLTSIRAALGLLENGVLGQLPPKALELIKVASKNSVRLITLVNDILDMDKLLSGQMTIHTDPVDMAALVTQAIEGNASYAASFKVCYQLHALPEKCIVVGDQDRLMQVMTNLLSNAAKFSKPEQVVEVRVVPAGPMLRIEIKDHGIGIAAEFQSHIFEEFAQANSTNTRHNGGTGLGLNITKKLIEKMDGSIGYNTVPGEGTTFWFTVPVSLKGLGAD